MADPAFARVLIVDDDPDQAESLRVLLEAFGYAARAEVGSAQAVQIAQIFIPDVAFLDLALPEMNGYELAKRLRALPRWASVRLIALSGYCRSADKQRAFAAGFDQHIAKPASLEQILAALPPIPSAPHQTACGLPSLEEPG